jgi:sirohydrochlorin cobaltochelatase
VEYAFQAAARPDVMEGVRHCKLLGARQVVVAPFILFTGTVEEEIRAASTQVGRAEALSILHAGPLGVDPLLLDVVVQRLQEAAGGAVAMNCDLCKYRLPMAGYERQAGQPQTTDHLHGGSGHDHPHDH